MGKSTGSIHKQSSKPLKNTSLGVSPAFSQQKMEQILTALEANVAKLYKERKFKEVEEMFTTFLKESENEDDAIKARALNNRGHTKYMQVEFEAALEDYNKALDLLPDFAVARYNRGTIFYRMSKFDKAKEDLQMAVDAEASNKEYLEALEKCEAELKK